MGHTRIPGIFHCPWFKTVSCTVTRSLLVQQGWLSTKLSGPAPLHPHTPALRLQACIATSSFLYGYWGFELSSPCLLSTAYSCPLSHLPGLAFYFSSFIIWKRKVFLLRFWKKKFSNIVLNIFWTLCLWVFYLCICLCTMCMPCAFGDQRKCWVPWNWNRDGCELPMLVLGTEPRSFLRATSALNCWVPIFSPDTIFWEF